VVALPAHTQTACRGWPILDEGRDFRTWPYPEVSTFGGDVRL